MPSHEYASSASDSDDDGSLSDAKALRGIDRLYQNERKSRLGNVQNLLPISAAGFVSNILVIVPDDKWDAWRCELKEESSKAPYHQVYIHDHDKAFTFRMTKVSHIDDQRIGSFSKTRIVLIPFSLLVKEYLHIWKYKGRDGKTSDFFTKHWGLVVLQNREQVPGTPHVAKAAAQIMTINGGRRYVIWDDDHWTKKTSKVVDASGSKDGGQQKRKKYSKIMNSVISKRKKRKFNQRKAMADDASIHEHNSDEEDYYVDDDEEIPAPKKKASPATTVSTLALSSLDDSLLNSPYIEVARDQQTSGQANVVETAEASVSLDDTSMESAQVETTCGRQATEEASDTESESSVDLDSLFLEIYGGDFTRAQRALPELAVIVPTEAAIGVDDASWASPGLLLSPSPEAGVVESEDEWRKSPAAMERCGHDRAALQERVQSLYSRSE